MCADYNFPNFRPWCVPGLRIEYPKLTAMIPVSRAGRQV